MQANGAERRKDDRLKKEEKKGKGKERNLIKVNRYLHRKKRGSCLNYG